MAGLLLVIPDLIGLDLPAMVTAGHPATIPAVSWLLSLLSLKLSGTRRVSHVDDHLLVDPAAALFAGLSTLPKKTALTDYSYRLSHDHQRRFLTALDQKMIGSEVLPGHVRLEIRSVDRGSLLLRQPRLQYGAEIHGFFCRHRCCGTLGPSTRAVR